MTTAEGTAVDPRAIAAGCWGCAGALFVSIADDGASRLSRGVVSIVLGLTLAAITWNRFPHWKGSSSAIAILPVVAALQLAVIVVVWWRFTS
jgi:hypothetical protein